MSGEEGTMQSDDDVSMPDAIPQLDALTASQLLEGVFAECEVEPNEVPMEALASYAPHRGEHLTLRGIAVAALVLLLLVPILFVTPAVSVEGTGLADDYLPAYGIEVRGLLPVSGVHATLGGSPVQVVERDDGSYVVEATSNGELSVSATLANRQSSTTTVEVTDYDDVAPTFLRSETDESSIHLYLEDEGTGVDYGRIYAMGADRQVIHPTNYDEAGGVVTFPYPESTTDVYVPDHVGNTLHLSMALEEG